MKYKLKTCPMCGSDKLKSCNWGKIFLLYIVIVAV
jgi:RNA polymerase subunit RPABC4/transcription elongation factor Spt4